MAAWFRLLTRRAPGWIMSRNGGHINPPLYHDYSELKEKHGEHAAKSLIAFRMSHVAEMLRISERENIQKQSQVRETEHLDVYTCSIAFEEAKENLAKWRAEMPLESSTFIVHGREEAIGVSFLRCMAHCARWLKCVVRNTTFPTMSSAASQILAAPCTHTAS